jgi:hypothetical protein
MTINEFKSSLNHPTPPAEISDILKAMWFDGKGDWDASHNIAQEIHTKEGSLIHAYLHRKEGDLGNASYWYHQAGRPVAKNSLQEEWEQIVKEFLPV